MEDAALIFWQELDRFVDAHRAQCLWYLREDFYPRASDEVIRTLDAIARQGDLAAFQKAKHLKQCLLQPSSAISAGLLPPNA